MYVSPASGATLDKQTVYVLIDSTCVGASVGSEGFSREAFTPAVVWLQGEMRVPFYHAITSLTSLTMKITKYYSARKSNTLIARKVNLLLCDGIKCLSLGTRESASCPAVRFHSSQRYPRPPLLQ